MKIKNIFFLISLIIFSSNFCLAMENFDPTVLQYSEHIFKGLSCEKVNFLTNGTLFIQELAPGEVENLKIFATPGVLDGLEIVLVNGGLSLYCPKANKDNFFGILKIKKAERLFLEQPGDWFFFNKDTEVFIFASLHPESRDDFISRVVGKITGVDGALVNDFKQTQRSYLQNICSLRTGRRVESNTIALNKLKDLYKEIDRRMELKRR